VETSDIFFSYCIQKKIRIDQKIINT
jgi:hypothetical protein